MGTTKVNSLMLHKKNAMSQHVAKKSCVVKYPYIIILILKN